MATQNAPGTDDVDGVDGVLDVSEIAVHIHYTSVSYTHLTLPTILLV